MQQMTLKFNMYVRHVGKTNIINNNFERIILRAIFLSFGVLVILYLFLLGNMVTNILERRSLEARARVLSSEVRDLELTYFAMSSKVDLSLAYSMGFKETKAIFATRKSLSFLPLSPLPSVSLQFGNIKMPQNEL